MTAPAIEIHDLVFHYEPRGFELNLPALAIRPAEQVAIVGASGCGKTTLAYLISGIFMPNRGRISVCGHCVSDMNDQQRRDFRISNIGFIFQEFELLDYLNVEENILLPFYLNQSLALTAAVRSYAGELAETVGLGDKLRRRPGALSQGEKQRLAVCRALITEPKLIMADEPTGNLDPGNTAAIMRLLCGHAHARGATFIMITHEHELLEQCDSFIDLEKLVRRGAV